MITQGMKQGHEAAASHGLSMPPVGQWGERLARTLFWTLWTLSPLPAEWVHPTLAWLISLGSRARSWLRDIHLDARKDQDRIKPAFGKGQSFAN